MYNYKHYLKLDDNDIDDNGYKKIVSIYTEGVNGTPEGSDVLLTSAQRLDGATTVARQAYFKDYITDYDFQKSYVWNSDDETIDEYELTNRQYGDSELSKINPLVEAKIASTFTDTDGDLYMLAPEYKITNMVNAKDMAVADSGFTAKFSFRDSGNGLKKNKTLTAAQIITMYTDAFSHVETIRTAWNDLEDAVWAAGSKGAVDTEISTFVSTYLS